MKRILIFLFILMIFVSSCGKEKKKPSPFPELKDVIAVNVETGDRFVLLSWILPADPYVKKIMVRRKENYPVASVTDGVEVYFSDLTTSVYDDSVSNNVLYYYKIFTSDGKHFSKGVMVQAIPQIPPDLTPPGEVYDVSVTEGENFVKIVWKNPSDPDFKGVIVVKREDSCPQSYEDGEVLYNGVLTGFTDRKVKNFHRYCYGFFTYDDSGNYSSGVMVWAEPFDITPPPEIEAFYVSSATDRVVISWVNPEDPDFDHIKLFRDGNLLYTSSGTEEVFIDTCVVTGETISYYITSCDQYENCTTGLAKNVTIPVEADTIPPSPVENFTGRPYPPGNGSVLEWKNPFDPDFAFVEVYVAPDSCPTYRSGRLVYAGPSTTYTDLSCGGVCINDRKYCYTAYALDASYNYSEGVTSVVIPHDSVPPSPVTSLTASSDEKGYVYLQWLNPGDTDFAGVNIYVVEGKCRKNLYTPEELESLSAEGYPVVLTGEVTTYIDSNPPLPSDRAHLCFGVSSRDETGNLSPAMVTTVTVIDTAPPHPLVSVEAVSLRDGSIYFQWTYPADPDVRGVKILRRMAESPDDDYFLPCNDDELASVFYPEDSFFDSTLSGASGAYYNYTFCVYDEWQNYSLPYELTVRSFDSQPPSPVSDVTYYSDSDGNMVEIFWSLPSDPDLAGVEVIRKTGSYPDSPSDPEGVVLLKGMSSEFTDLSVVSGNVYYYAIYAYDYNNNFSKPVSFGVEVNDVKAPGEVTHINFHDPFTTDSFRITWINPTDDDFSGVTVIVNKTGVPLSHDDGEILYRGKESSLVVNQPPDTIWYYAFYTSDEVPNYSEGVVIPYYRTPVSHVAGGTVGERIKMIDYGGRLFLLYYSTLFTRGVVLERRDYSGNIEVRKNLTQFSTPSFFSLAKSVNNIWVLLGGDVTELLKLDFSGNVVDKLRINGKWNKGELSSCTDHVALILNRGDSSYLYRVYEDMSYEVKEIPGAEEFNLTCFGSDIYHTFSNNRLYLGDITNTTQSILRSSEGGYSIALTVTPEGWRILYQRINGPFVSLASETFDGKVTDYVVADYLTFPVFVRKDEFTGFYPTGETPSIIYGKFGPDGVNLYPVSNTEPSSLDAIYSEGVTFVIFQDSWDSSLYLLWWENSWITEQLIQTDYYTYLDVVTTSSGDFALTDDLRGVKSIISLSGGNVVTSDTSILHMASDGENLYILRKDENQSLHILKTDPYFSSSSIIDPGVKGVDGRICVDNGIFLLYLNDGILYSGVITSVSQGGTDMMVIGVIGSGQRFGIECNDGRAIVSRIYTKDGKIYGDVSLVYLSSTTEVTVKDLWSTIMTSYPPSVYGKISGEVVDIFYNNKGINWVRIDISGNQINRGDYFGELKPVDFKESNDLEFVVFRELTGGDLYLGRYIGGKWYFAQVDSNGDCGSYPSVMTGNVYDSIYYLCGGGIYRALFR